MLGSLRVKPESSYQQPIDPPPGSDSTAAAGEKTGFGRTGSSLSQNDSAFFFLQGEASDVTIQKEEVNPSCDIVMASSGGSHG